MNRFFPFRISLFIAVLCLGVGTFSWADAESKVDVEPTWDQGKTIRIALLPVESGKKQLEGVAHVRRALYGRLMSIPEFHMVEPMAVDTLLERAGLLQGDAWKDASSEQLGDILAVDYLLYPELAEWSQKYLLLQANTNVAVKAKIIEVDSGKLVYKAESKCSYKKGLTGIPTGTAALALEPIRGMSDRYLYDCAYETTSALVNSLQPPREAEEGEESAQESYPTVTNAQMSFEDRVLIVDVQGSHGCTASFFVGQPNRLFPLSEIEAGHYRGRYIIPEGAAFDPSHLSIRLVASSGESVVAEVM